MQRVYCHVSISKDGACPLSGRHGEVVNGGSFIRGMVYKIFLLNWGLCKFLKDEGIDHLHSLTMLLCLVLFFGSPRFNKYYLLPNSQTSKYSSRELV